MWPAEGKTSLGPKPKTNPSVDRFRVKLEAIDTRQMRSGDETSVNYHITHLMKRIGNLFIIV